jgi:branched-chain amino acid transport system substrate-binding protein
MKTNIPDGGTPQGFGVKFSGAYDKLVGENTRAKSVIMQWQDGALRVVWPAALATSTPKAPMTTWANRAK